MSANTITRESLATLSPAKLALLELRLKQQRRAATQSIPHATDRDWAPPSYGQEGLWVLNQLLPGSSIYHTPTAARLTGTLDVTALKQALNSIVARHQTLRTTFSIIDGDPRQVIAAELSIEVPLVDLTELPATEREAEAGRRVRQEASRPFDLSRGPLIRALLLRLDANDHMLVVTMHHIVTDGWSVGVLHQELTALYEAFSAGKPSPLSELPIQYADYAEWQRQRFESGAYESQLSYWKQQFATPPPVLELPTDHPRPGAQAYREFRGAQLEVSLSKQVTKDLKQFCQEENVTLFMTLLTAYQVLLYRYTSEEDIVVGTPIAGRPMPETENLIGLFINTLALRTSLAGNPTARELLRRVKETALAGYANQDVPFEQLVKEVQPDRSLAANPLFQAMFVLQSEDLPSLQLPGLNVKHFRVGGTRANFDLTLDIIERDGQLNCLFESNADLFEAETIARMTGHFQNLLAGLIANPEQRISQMPLLTDAERRQLLVEWNDTKTDYPAHLCMQELFEQEVARRPNAIAVISQQGRMTYRELNRQANQLAHHLRKRGVKADTRVGVSIDRSPAMIVALLGILKAGGAYVPLDPNYPEARLQFMLADARISLLVTQKSQLAALPATSVEVICVDEMETIGREREDNPELITTAENLAYVIYTSGSTGRPKGVAVEHRSVVRLVRNTNFARFAQDEVFFQGSTVSFDVSTFEIWGSLLNGAGLALAPGGVPSLSEWAQLIKEYKVTTLWLTAGLFHLMVDEHLEDLRGVRQFLAGGDILSVPHVRKVFKELPDCRMINGYGPTENTTFTCCYTVNDLAEVNGSVPIGRPISNTTAYVLDAQMNPQPIGVPGELYTGGDGVARGYLDRPELNAERFVRDPFSTVAGARLYKTGDLVRYKKNGVIEFIGRMDNQVKVRGFRIELGEIEAALAEHPAVREAAVVAHKDQGDKHLAAYLVAEDDQNLVVDEVRDFLKQSLPAHMVPSVFAVMETLPLSPSGKVDRRALPATNSIKSATTAARFNAPEDELELKLTRIWERVLGINSISVDDNFFELGGHSLLAVRLFAQIEKAFGRNLPLATLFQAPTVKQLARALREEGWPTTWSSLVPIQTGGSRKPFFCIHAAGGNVLEYRDLARLLGPDQPFYGLQAKGLDGEQEPHTAIKEMATHYIREMRDVQPEGPYLIGGRSSGGTIAFEMACQLSAVGQQVALLALLDTYPAGYFKLLPGSGTLSQRAARYAKKMESHVDNLRQLSVREKVDYLLNKLQYAPEKIKHKLYRRAYKIYQRVGRPLPPVLQNIEEINFAAVKDYVPQSYRGDVTLFLASDLTADYDLHDGWRELVVGDIETHEIPGNHINIIKEPHVGALAEELRRCLDKARDDRSKVLRAA